MTRQCGDCQLCCKVLPVGEIKKPANTRCEFQIAHKGCRIYGRRMPTSCQLWSCRWLNGDAGDTRRPDRTHYVIDTMPDYVTLSQDGKAVQVPVVQVWVDPDFPDAHRDPHLRAYLDEQGRKGHIALVRYSSNDAFALIPPSIGDGEWHEMRSESAPEGQHRFSDIVSVMATGEIEQQETTNDG